MDTPMQIVFDGLEPSDAITDLILTKTGKLEQYYGHIIDARAIVKKINKRHRQGPVFDLTLEVNVPGQKLVVSRNPGDYNRHDQHLAPLINDSFAAMTRQLEEYSAKQRSDVKTHDMPLQGKIINLFPEQDYGFISMTDGQEVYFHKNAVINTDFEELETGMPVRLVVAPYESPAGLQASTVEAIGSMQYIDRRQNPLQS